jgi:hypothetical protein
LDPGDPLDVGSVRSLLQELKAGVASLLPKGVTVRSGYVGYDLDGIGGAGAVVSPAVPDSAAGAAVATATAEAGGPAGGARGRRSYWRDDNAVDLPVLQRVRVRVKVYATSAEDRYSALILHSPYSPYCTHHTALTILHSPYCTHHTALAILHSPYCTHHTALTILYSPYCTHHIALTILYSPYCTHHTVLTILHSPYCTHYTHTLYSHTIHPHYTHTLYSSTIPIRCTRTAGTWATS